MDTKKILDLIGDNLGEIKIKGVGLTRSAYLFDEKINTEPIDWGWDSEGCLNFSKSILSIMIPKEQVEQRYKELNSILTCILPANFDIYFNIMLYLGIAFGDITIEDKIKAVQLTRIKIGKFYYPMLLYFYNMPYKSCRFKKGSIEWETLNSLNKEGFDNLTEAVSKFYWVDRSNSNHHKKVFYKLYKDGGKYIVEGGQGKGINTGLSSDVYYNQQIYITRN